MTRRILLLSLAAGFAAFAQQKYDGPKPPKPDLPYLKHAQNLVPTEAVEAKEEKRKDASLFSIDGAASSAKTPLASPIFIMQADKIVPDRLGLYRLDVKGGRREILFGTKKQPKPIRLDVSRLGGNLYKLEVGDSLEPGEYSLSPEGSNKAFCFEVF